MIPRLSFGESELLAVPAVHNRSVFAEQVNRACREDATRPDAVAVELSQDAVSAVVAWLKELGAGPGSAGNIPCMLGLVKSNRRIHPRHREAAIRLQENHGLPLHEIPPDILRQQINFSPVSLLCLSNTDSMIEAIRMAVELEIPIHGVDLGAIASAERGQPFLPDPILAQNNLASYVERTGTSCGLHRDTVIDGRREVVMAARLKRLLRQYRRVLFTGGLGHWSELSRLLSEATLRPAVDPSQSEGEHFTRVVVAPALAIHQMDLFPDLADRYEALRQLPLGAAERLIDYAALYRAKLAAAYECAEPKNRDAADEFSRFLTNLALVHQCRVPDLFMTLHAANVMISAAFATRLGEALVIKALKWARPDEWPGLPYLCNYRPNGRESPASSSGQRVQLRKMDGSSAPFYVAHSGSTGNQGTDWRLPPLPDPDAEGDKQEQWRPQYSSWVWPPCESLLFGTAYEGTAIAQRNRREPNPEPFAGSLHEGVDIKATMRAVIRGERRVQVRVESATGLGAAAGEGGDEPAVFIFDRESAAKDGRWEPFMASYGSDVRRLVRDVARYDQATRKNGDSFIASVSFCTNREPRAELQGQVSALCYLYGIVLFSNPCLNVLQAARWLEASDYARCPILRSSDVGDLFQHYRRQHGISLDRDRWTSSLIRLALPYATQRVTVIMPQTQAIPNEVFREAAARKIRLEIVPLNRFPRQRIDAIRHQYFVRPDDMNAMKYSESLQAAFGESPTAHLDLLPGHVRAQLERES